MELAAFILFPLFGIGFVFYFLPLMLALPHWNRDCCRFFF